MTTSSGQNGRYRRALRADVLATVRGRKSTSRADLERELNLSRPVVAGAVDQLVAEGLLVERPGSAGRGPGRPGRILQAASPPGCLVGVDIGHDHIAVAIAGTDLRVEAEHRLALAVDADSTAALNTAAAMVEEILTQVGVTELSDVRACVVGLPGPLDAGKRSVASPTILVGWIGLDVAEELSLRTGLSIAVDNDANLGALAEHHLGAAISFDDFIYIKASGGVGAGVVLGGRTVYGSFGAAGEIGHTQLSPTGQWCRCGNRGCLETVVSVDQVLQQVTHLYPPGFPLRANLLEVAQHPVARKVFGESGRTLGVVLANLCALLDPAAVIIGGELGQASPAFVDGVRDSITRLAQPGFDGRVTVAPAALGVRAELLGCLIAAQQQVFSATVGAGPGD